MWDLPGPEMELMSPSLVGSLLLSHQGSPGLGFLADNTLETLTPNAGEKNSSSSHEVKHETVPGTN